MAGTLTTVVVHAHPGVASSTGGVLAAYSIRRIPAGFYLGETTGGATR